MPWKISYGDILDERGVEIVEIFDSKEAATARLRNIPTRIVIHNSNGTVHASINRIGTSIWEDKQS